MVRRTLAWVSLVSLLMIAPTALALQPGQQAPKRLYSNGDSITRAFDANLPGDNLSNSRCEKYTPLGSPVVPVV